MSNFQQAEILDVQYLSKIETVSFQWIQQVLSIRFVFFHFDQPARRVVPRSDDENCAFRKGETERGAEEILTVVFVREERESIRETAACWCNGGAPRGAYVAEAEDVEGGVHAFGN